MAKKKAARKKTAPKNKVKKVSKLSRGKSMKAMVFYEKETMKLEEKRIPEPADDELLVKVEACGFCGSDLAYYFGASSLETKTGKGPLVLGLLGDLAVDRRVAGGGDGKEGAAIRGN